MKYALFSLAVTSAVLLGSGKSYAQAKLVETVQSGGKDLVIPYSKYLLPNGLTLIVHEDHSDPIVHVDVTYHVGSAREEIGKSGFAHFFEHMMFQGSENVADEEHFRIITEAGGTLNGTTNRDRTNYFETVPANQLEKMLWLEADRMGFFLDAVTTEKFEVQRATVKNERGQRYDNVPYGLVGEVSGRSLYPYGHPYSWLTIGYVEDLDRVGVEDLKNFFLRWYGPNNAVLTVGGDVHTESVVKLVEKYFGSIPRGPEVEPAQIPLPRLEASRYVSMKDEYAKLPMLRITYPAAQAYHKDQPALQCLAEIIGSGSNSLLYTGLVKTGKAVSASGYYYGSELAGEFTLGVIPFRGNSLKDMEKEIRNTLSAFEKRGVTDEDIAKFKARHEASLIYRLESVSGKVSRLAAYETFTGDANYIVREMERYAALTKEDVMNAYQTYIRNKPAVILSVTTAKESGNRAGKDNYTVSTEGYNAPDYGYDKLKYVKGTDVFDRSVMPAAGPVPVVNTPEIWKGTLPGNIRIIGTQSEEIPVVYLNIHFRGGLLAEAAYAGKSGLAGVVASMLEEDTEHYTAEAFADELEKLGSEISFSVERDALSVGVKTLTRNLDRTLVLLEERLLRPAFNEADFERNRKRSLEHLRNAMNQPTYVAGNVFRKTLYGDVHPFGQPEDGTLATLNAITLADVKDYYAKFVSARDARIVVVGAVNEEAITKGLAFLQRMPAHEVALPVLEEPRQTPGGTIYLVDIPGAAQTEFRIGTITGRKYDALGAHFQSSVVNYPLGGAFNSRINLMLREEKGWTYGARSYFSADQYAGTFGLSSGIKADATDSALRVILDILGNYTRKGMTAEELKFTQSAMTQGEALKYETIYQKAGFLYHLMKYELPNDYTAQQHLRLQGLSADEAAALAGTLVPEAGQMKIVLVGDKKLILPGLLQTELPIEELDPQGNKIEP